MAIKNLFTADGSNLSIGAERGILIIGDSGVADGQPRNNLGTNGVITLEYLEEFGDASDAAKWHPVMDTGSGVPVLMEFTTAPQAVSLLNFGAVRRVRVTLSGATAPNVYAAFLSTDDSVKKYTDV